MAGRRRAADEKGRSLREVTGRGVEVRRSVWLGVAEAAAAPGERGGDVSRREDGGSFRPWRGGASQAAFLNAPFPGFSRGVSGGMGLRFYFGKSLLIGCGQK